MSSDCLKPFSEFVKSFGPLITASVTIALFYFASRRDKKKDRAKALKEQMNKVKYFNYVAKDAMVIYDKQLKALNEHLHAVEQQKYLPQQLSHYNKDSCKMLAELMSNEAIFIALCDAQATKDEDVVANLSKVNTKSIFANHLLEAIVQGVKDNFDYIHKQTKLIQGGIDELLRAVNLLSISLQKNGFNSQEDADFVGMVKDLDKKLYGDKKPEIEDFYNHFIMPLQDVVSACKTRMFSDIDGLLVVARTRDKAERMYNELFGSHQTYFQTLTGEANRLQSVCNELTPLLEKIKPRTI